MKEVNLKDLFEELREKAIEYAPDYEYMEDDGVSQERFSELVEEDFQGLESVLMAAGCLSEWFPDCVSIEEQRMLEGLIKKAHSLA